MPAEQVLRIEPEHELKFKGPFNVASTTVLKLTNPSERRVCFKIKTTAPKRYCVRPNAGILEPGASASIAVIFQPCDLEPTANKHKFMVQSLFVPDGDVNCDALWKDADTSIIMDTKLRCAFDLPGDNSGNQNDLNDVNSVEDKVTRARKEEVHATRAQPKGDTADGELNMSADTIACDDTMVEDNRGVGDVSGRLQQEMSQIKNENSFLKDELDKLRRQLKSREASGSMGMAMPVASPPAVPMVYIVLALVAVLIGLIMGKFIL